MPIIARLIGGAGTGKTTELMNIMTKTLESGVKDPLKIGFCAFTRAARREAAERAASTFGTKTAELENEGWFRTLHSVCYKTLGVGKELLAGSRDDAKWIEQAVDATVAATVADDDLFADFGYESTTEAGAALRLWDAARNRLVPLAVVHAAAEDIDDRTPSLEECAAVVDRYERAKRLDHRCDFVDLLGRFAGKRFTVDGVEDIAPDGYVPALPVWLLDEQQDTSALLDAVCKRLIAPADWVYVVGDPFQAIYGWAGADARLFQAWPAAKERIMPKSYRCGREVLELGEDILREAGDYWDRGIAPADHESAVERNRWTPSLVDDVDPRESWLLIARTNFHAARLAGALKSRGIPWLPTKGNGTWNAPNRHTAILTMRYLEQGQPVPGGSWKRAVEQLPAKLLTRGTKTRFAELTMDAADETHPCVTLDDAPGGTAELVAAVQSGSWRGMVDHADEVLDAIEKWGERAVREPQVRVGTIHSVKGAEADNVIWLTSTSTPIARACESDEGFNEETRCSYVAATRARKRLIVAVEVNAKHRTRVPA